MEQEIEQNNLTAPFEVRVSTYTKAIEIADYCQKNFIGFNFSPDTEGCLIFNLLSSTTFDIKNVIAEIENR